MQTFVFTVHDGELNEPFELALPDAHAAKAEAARCMASLLAEEPGQLWDPMGWRLSVSDHNGLTLFELYAWMSEAPALGAELPALPRPLPER